MEQGPADGHEVAVGHGGQHVALGGGPGGEGEELGDASGKRKHSFLHQKIPRALGDDGGGVADVQHGQRAQEEVHGVWRCGLIRISTVTPRFPRRKGKEQPKKKKKSSVVLLGW